MKAKEEKKIPEKKRNSMNKLKKLIESKRTILVASIKNIPGSQFQEITKKFRDKAIILVSKKNLIIRAIDSAADEKIKSLKEQIQDSTAILFSDIDCFELATELIDKKSPAKAKAGQIATEDIEIPAGPTDMTPGPAISELGALGIQILIDKGKISIKQPKIITMKGEKISSGAADIMNKLDIKPFSIGFIPLAAFDTKEGKLYLNININREGILNKMRFAHEKAFPFAVQIGYANKDTIGFLIEKAGMHEKTLGKFINIENAPQQNSGEEDKQ